MKAYAIVIKDNEISEHGYKRLVQSSNSVGNTFNINRFDAITPPYVDDTLAEHNIKWNYPSNGREIDIASGLTKSAYKTRNPKARIACALSHYLLWKTCVNLKEPVLVLEHDASFIAPIDFDPSQSNMFILGINNPLGATRKARDFYNAIIQNPQKFQRAPEVDRQEIPQGLAGNSAYIIKPPGAQAMLRLVKDYGLWPNDALMCRQLIPRLGVTKKFYTKVQGLKSTTTQ